MTRLSDQQVDAIAQQVLRQLGGRDNAPADSKTSGTSPQSQGSGPKRLGAFNDLDAAVNAAQAAFEALDGMKLVKRDEIIAAIRKASLRESESLAFAAHKETGFGRYEDKIIKNRLVANKTPGTEVLQAQAKTGDGGLSLFEYAPFGVIGSITPSTNPTATIINNTISMVAAGNAVVFNVHPSAKECSLRCVDILNRAIVEVGGPENLIVTMAEPTQESAQALMVHKGIRLVVVTGGAGVVDAAMKSGKRAICAGPGNPPIVVDETCDIEQAGRDIVLGASFDNNVICTDEKEAFVVASVADKVLAAAAKNNAVVLTQSQTRQLENLIFKEVRGPRQVCQGEPRVYRQKCRLHSSENRHERARGSAPRHYRCRRQSSARVDRANDAHHASRSRG